MTINCKGQLIDLSTPKVMGILNVTPNSFFDGGKYKNESEIRSQVEKMLKALVVKATINFIVKWRVYFAGELLATFENEQDAKDYANFIDQQDNN